MANHHTPSAHQPAGFGLLADNIAEGVVVIQDRRIVYINNRLPEMLGYSPEEMLRIDRREFVHPDEAEMMFDARDRRERGEEAPVFSELRMRRKDGRYLHIKNHTAVIDWAGERATLHFLEDVTNQKQTEIRLREEREVNAILANTVRRILEARPSLEDIGRAILESALFLTESIRGAVLIEEAGRVRILDNRCDSECDVCTLTDLRDKVLEDEKENLRYGRLEGSFFINQAVERGPNCVLPPESRVATNLLRVPARSDRGDPGEIILSDSPEGYTEKDLEYLEKIAEVLAVALARHRADDDTRIAKEKAEKEAEDRSRFLASVSHEIRSPLNGVMMMSSLLDETDLNDEQRELLRVVLFSAKTIDRLIRDLTDLTQIRTGKITILSKDFDLESLCRTVVEGLRPRAEDKGLAMAVNFDPGCRYYVGDSERIGQILSNLLFNAIKYTDEGRVDLAVRQTEEHLLVAVRDTGIGIREEERDILFDLFRQGDGADTRRDLGVGIGLSVVKGLVDAMGGRVEVESLLGKGSEFRVHLPLACAEEPGEASWIPGMPGLPGKARILVAEDERVNRLYLRTLLRDEGWIIDEATDGVEAVGKVRANTYDLVLMDISMPRMDGIEATREIRGFSPDLPIIAITAHAYEEDRRRILEAGLDDIVLKPIDDEALRRSMANLLVKSR